MKTPSWAKLSVLLFSTDDPSPDRGAERSTYERFAIPYTFKPNLSLGEAVLAAALAFLRIFLGSMLFAVWGVNAIRAWNAVSILWLRPIVLLPVILLFIALFGLLMIGISMLGRFIRRF